jgi:ATP adenylyltransferase/5',5'''-P-1,P-4-tetraphosphate phosphorylase II
MEFRICPALATKPHTVGASNPAFSQTRKYGPGSDLFCPDERLNLCQLNDTHTLALNLFCVDRPQLLMLTLDSYKRQYEPLDDNDLTAALEVLRRWEGWYVIFNCGERAGCSRVHKHLQGLRGPPYAFEALRKSEKGDREGRVPFEFFMRRFEDGYDVEAVRKVYEEMLGKCRKALGLSAMEFCPHNVVLWDGWIVVIPRNKGMWEGASANTGGMLGSVWVPDQAEVDKWLRVGCASVLRELGVPSQK